MSQTPIYDMPVKAMQEVDFSFARTSRPTEVVSMERQRTAPPWNLTSQRKASSSVAQ